MTELRITRTVDTVIAEPRTAARWYVEAIKRTDTVWSVYTHRPAGAGWQANDRIDVTGASAAYFMTIGRAESIAADAEILAAVERGIAAGSFARFDPAAW